MNKKDLGNCSECIHKDYCSLKEDQSNYCIYRDKKQEDK